MTITLTYTFANAEELAEHVNLVRALRTGPSSPPTIRMETAAKKPDAPAASSPSGAQPQTTAKPAAAQETATTPDAGKPEPTVDTAKALTMRIVADKGRDAAVALLKEYGVPVAAKLPADQVAAFCADAEKVLA